MRIGIDASNLRSGGSITHLEGILRHGTPTHAGIDSVLVWGSAALTVRLRKISRPGLRFIHEPILDRGLLSRMWWKSRELPQLLKQFDCNLLYVPAGACPTSFHPVVTMSRNLLPFEAREYRRFGKTSWMYWKMKLLQRSQVNSFRHADGVIFLTDHAKRVVTKITGKVRGQQIIIPHGIDDSFRAAPRSQRAAGDYHFERPYRFLYVSKIDAPKHQWHVARAVAELRKDGLPIAIDFVGPTDWQPGLKKLQQVTAEVDPQAKFIRHLPGVPHAELPQTYQQADAFVFASSCENMPNILIEAMAAGLPIAVAERGPMPQIVGSHGAYFDPESPGSIAACLRKVFEDAEARAVWAEATFQAAEQYSWKRCADDTFAFLANVGGVSQAAGHVQGRQAA